ncbi:MAG: protein kinase [Gemmatimonadales bacterium]
MNRTADPAPERRCRHCGVPLHAAATFCSKCGAAAVAPAAAADPLLERLRALLGHEIEIERELGRGGMAAVYSAFDTALQRRVAVKVLRADIAHEEGAAGRFLQEARTVASLRHPHVVTIYAVRSGEGVQAIVMEYVEGRSLDVLLAEQSPLPMQVAALVLAHAADGLQHAHDRGVVHRDVKPANVLLDHDGRAVVSDFGLARRATSPRLTGTGLVVGTWAYMSPEQRQGEPTTAASDQYAFGVMAFELLTGRRPFTGTPQEILRAHLEDPPPSMRAMREEIPPGVESLVHRMLAKAAADRLPNLREAKKAFESLVPDASGTTKVLASLSLVRSAAIAPLDAPAIAPLDAPAIPPLGAPAIPPAAKVPVAPADPRSAVTERYAEASTAKPAGPARLIAAAATIALVAGGAWIAIARFGGGAAAPAQVAPSPAPAPQSPAAAVNPADANVSAAKGGNAARDARGGATAPARGTAPSEALADPARGAAPPPKQDAKAAEPPQHVASESTATRAPASAPPAATAPATNAPTTIATLADARKVGREFATILNQHRWRDLEQLPSTGGTATLRDEMIRLTRNAPEFDAGFDRVASAPIAARDGFDTEFVLDLQWRGGKRLMTVRAHAVLRDGEWHLAGFAVDSAE